MTARRKILPDDIMDPAEYARTRVVRRRLLASRKRDRRVAIGPHITFYFENYETMWHQVHEMLHIERGGAEQITDELAAYNPLIPQGEELVATFMVEIDDEVRRRRVLGALGGIEDTAFIRIGDWTIRGVPEVDTDRTNADGKASSVQFVHFPFTPSQIQAFRTPGAQVVLGLSHPNYGHMAVLTEPVRSELAEDFA